MFQNTDYGSVANKLFLYKNLSTESLMLELNNF